MLITEMRRSSISMQAPPAANPAICSTVMSPSSPGTDVGSGMGADVGLGVGSVTCDIVKFAFPYTSMPLYERRNTAVKLRCTASFEHALYID